MLNHNPRLRSDPGQRKLLLSMMRASAEIYNLLIDFLRYKREAWQQAEIVNPEKLREADPFADIRQAG